MEQERSSSMYAVTIAVRADSKTVLRRNTRLACFQYIPGHQAQECSLKQQRPNAHEIEVDHTPCLTKLLLNRGSAGKLQKTREAKASITSHLDVEVTWKQAATTRCDDNGRIASLAVFADEPEIWEEV